MKLHSDPLILFFVMFHLCILNIYILITYFIFITIKFLNIKKKKESYQRKKKIKVFDRPHYEDKNIKINVMGCFGESFH